ncbi:ABC transporter substrate-binding protein [Pararhodonellum marinum]|uniref:ABC transporter substrate-binding protein n=1 Tax=Pararhodonellum marinum TaxID=2755358 RepID=UPI001E3B249D|nr:ABC transporter substrate-binding protein [Pararhodonellum marinum]
MNIHAPFSLFTDLRIWYLLRQVYHLLLLAGLLGALCFSCHGPEKQGDLKEATAIPLSYAKGFGIWEGDGHFILEVSQGFPGAHQPFRYLVLKEGGEEVSKEGFDAVIRMPVKRVIVTSTTHIPHLDYLNASGKLIGFPNLELISSEKTRDIIDSGQIKDLGSGAQANIERMIDLEPDWVMLSTLGEDLGNLELLRSAGVAAVINGEYVEQHPLGRAEWIKFTGVLLNQLEQATAIFEEIASAYQAAAKLTENLTSEQKPTVMAGVMYKDIWYVPGGDSWGTRLLETAGGRYIFENQTGTGSVQLGFESVLDQAYQADFWIGASDFTSLQSMKTADRRYTAFKSFQTAQVYTYTLNKGSTGGITYFELGYMRPDLILKDLIKILHPALLPDYSLYFYTRLDEK